MGELVLRKFVELLRNEQGATAIEYGLVAGLVAIGVLAALVVFGTGLTDMFNSVADKSADAMAG